VHSARAEQQSIFPLRPYSTDRQREHFVGAENWVSEPLRESGALRDGWWFIQELRGRPQSLYVLADLGQHKLGGERGAEK